MTKNNDCQVVTTRIVNANREKVFKAWTDPNHLKNWWGPHGFTNTFQQFDLRPGGTWKFIMHGPDKGNYPNEVVFTAIEPPAMLSWYRISKPLFSILVNFEAVTEGQTKVIFTMIFDTPEECNKLRDFVVPKNEENFDRLEDELSGMNF